MLVSWIRLKPMFVRLMPLMVRKEALDVEMFAKDFGGGNPVSYRMGPGVVESSLWAWMVIEPLSLNIHLPRSPTFLMFMRFRVRKEVPLIFVGEIAVDIL